MEGRQPATAKAVRAGKLAATRKLDRRGKQVKPAKPAKAGRLRATRAVKATQAREIRIRVRAARAKATQARAVPVRVKAVRAKVARAKLRQAPGRKATRPPGRAAYRLRRGLPTRPRPVP